MVKPSSLHGKTTISHGKTTISHGKTTISHGKTIISPWKNHHLSMEKPAFLSDFGNARNANRIQSPCRLAGPRMVDQIMQSRNQLRHWALDRGRGFHTLGILSYQWMVDFIGKSYEQLMRFDDLEV